MYKTRNYERELKSIMDFLAESVLDADDEMIAEEIRANGLDPEETAEDTRQVLQTAVANYQKGKLDEARKVYDQKIKKIEGSHYSLPSTPEERSDLLNDIFHLNPSIQSLLTAHYRDFSKLSDNDIQSLLIHLKELGVLNKIKEDS